MARPVPPLPTLLAAFAAALAAACGGKGHVEARRVLVVGWDGATFDLLLPLVEEGALPHLASLIERGRTSRLESTRIPISSAAWPTLATGRGPGEHGVYSFFRPEPGSYDARLVSARDVDAPPLWRILSARGHRVHVWGVPVTYPPEPVDGTLVAGMLSPFDADYAWPEGTADRLRARGFVPDLGIWRQDQVADMAEVERQLAIKEAELLELAARRNWSFAMFVFKSLDVLCHRPQLRLDGPEVRWLLTRLDGILGRLVEAAGDDTAVMVVSDHGFRSYGTVLDLHRWLLEEGISVARDDATLEGAGGDNLAERRGAERAARLGLLEMGRTRAWAGACEGPYGSIRLNVVGREPAGALAPEDVDAFVEELTARLMAVEFPAGEPVVNAVTRGDELYPGPHAGTGGAVPDLIVELREDVRCVAGGFGPVLGRSAPFPDHALAGIYVLAGPGIPARGETRTNMSLEQVAPTVLHLLGEPVPSGMGAEPDAGVLPGVPVRRIDDGEDPSLIPTAEAFRGRGADGEDAEVTSRVRGLGYGR